MPAHIFALLLAVVMTAAGLTIFAGLALGLPVAALGFASIVAALGLRLWIGKK